MEEFKHLSFASSLCGACTAVCPVKIDLHNLLLLNRKESYDKKLVAQSDKIAFQMWKKGMMSRSTMNFMGATMKNLSLNTFFKSAWGKRRSMPKVAPKSFNELWKARRK